MGRTRKYFLFIAIQLIYAISGQEVQKRVPQGFLGMRGKKFESESTEQFYKRKPQFFVGVKGKKNMFDLLESSEEKRAPMGFVGMRGKKEFFLPDVYPGYDLVPKRGSLIGQIDYTASDEDQNNYDFPLFNELLNKYMQQVESQQATETPEAGEYERISNEVEKRAANIHQFFGVRGKKSVQEKRPYDLTFRGKFIGVRGKKDLKNSGPHEIRFLLGSNSPWPKRRGFVGMRGKKWTDESSLETETPN